MDEMENADRTARLEAMVKMASRALRDGADPPDRQGHPVFLDDREQMAMMALTDGMELRGWMAVTALPVPRDRPGLRDRAVRRVNAARRVSRALRGILARLVRRANL